MQSVAAAAVVVAEVAAADVAVGDSLWGPLWPVAMVAVVYLDPG